MRDDLIALFELVDIEGAISVATERHYRLVPPGELSKEELKAYAATCES